MGNNETSQHKKSEIIDVELTHQKFVNSKLVKVENAVNVQTIIGCEEKDYDQWKKSLEAVKQQSDHLFLPLSWQFSSKNLCGSSGHATLNFPYYPYLLSEEIYNRLGKRTRFEQTDLWYLLYSLAAAKQEIKRFGLKSVGDIRTGNIFLNDEGRVKVGCYVSWPNELSVWEKAMDKEAVYMAPEEFERLRRGEAEHESPESQVFAIGLTMLNSGLLIDDANVVSLYDYKEAKFNFGEYNRRLNEWVAARGYSDILKALVINLYSLYPEGRVTHEELWDMLKNHGEEIKDRKNFVITNAPGKIHQEVRRYRQTRAKLGQVFMPNSLKELETSTVVKHEIAHGILPREGMGLEKVLPYSLENNNQGNLGTNLETVNSANLQGSQGQQVLGAKQEDLKETH